MNNMIIIGTNDLPNYELIKSTALNKLSEAFKDMNIELIGLEVYCHDDGKITIKPNRYYKKSDASISEEGE